jgi:hypothetical protein
MAQFFTDFSDYTTGTVPSEWNTFSGTEGVFTVVNRSFIGTKALNRSSASGDSGLRWTSIGSALDPQVLAVLEIKDTGTSKNEIYLRQNTGADGYRIDYAPSTGVLRVRTGVSSSAESVSTGIILGIGDYVAIRAENRGGEVRAKVWIWGSAEPSSWQLVSVRSQSSGGYVGVFSGGSTGAYHHYYAVGTEGDVAPMPGGAGVTTLSINESDPQEVIVSQTLQLTIALSNPVGSTEWVSGTPSVATVSSNGLVTGISEGSALITATNNSVSDSITVNVIDPEAGLIAGTAQYYDAVDQQIKAATSGTFVAISPTGTRHTAAIGSNGSYSLTGLNAGLYDTYARIPVGPDILTSQVKQVNVT